MHVNAYGPTDPSATFVLLHGFPGGADDWRPVAEALAEGGSRVLVPDLLGFGASPRPGSFEGLWTGAQADAVAAALDAGGVRSAVVVGHDYGGPVAVTLADRRPDLVGALVLANTNIFPDTPVTLPLSLVRLPLLGWVAERLLFSAPSLAMLAGRLAVSPDVRLHANDRSEARSIRILFAGVLRQLADLYTPILEAAGRLAVPTLVLWGAGDPFFDVTQGRRTADVLGARFELLDGVGHLPPAEAPDRVAALLTGWRDEIAAGDPSAPVGPDQVASS